LAAAASFCRSAARALKRSDARDARLEESGAVLRAEASVLLLRIISGGVGPGGERRKSENGRHGDGRKRGFHQRSSLCVPKPRKT
jgi:hypothetical protein